MWVLEKSEKFVGEEEEKGDRAYKNENKDFRGVV